MQRLLHPRALMYAAACVTVACQSAAPTPANTPAPEAETTVAAPSATPATETPVAAPSPTPEAETSVAAPAATTNSDDASTLDGVYTVAQAERGAGVFDAVCSECHKTEEWADDAFRDRWHDESVFRFWYYIYEQMPNGSPPYTLTREQVTDVVTYILQLNGLPTGAAELGTDDDSIDQYWLRWAPR